MEDGKEQQQQQQSIKPERNFRASESFEEDKGDDAIMVPTVDVGYRCCFLMVGDV